MHKKLIGVTTTHKVGYSHICFCGHVLVPQKYWSSKESEWVAAEAVEIVKNSKCDQMQHLHVQYSHSNNYLKLLLKSSSSILCLTQFLYLFMCIHQSEGRVTTHNILTQSIMDVHKLSLLIQGEISCMCKPKIYKALKFLQDSEP